MTRKYIPGGRHQTNAFAQMKMCPRLCIDDLCRGNRENTLCGGSYCDNCNTLVCFDESLCEDCRSDYCEEESEMPL